MYNKIYYELNKTCKIKKPLKGITNQINLKPIKI